jgi:hypothetical protein
MNQSRTNRLWRSAAQFLFGGIPLALLTLNGLRDGTFRTVRVEINSNNKRKLIART